MPVLTTIKLPLSDSFYMGERKLLLFYCNEILIFTPLESVTVNGKLFLSLTQYFLMNIGTFYALTDFLTTPMLSGNLLILGTFYCR